MKNSPKVPIHLFTIYAIVRSNRDIHYAQIVCNGVEINLPDMVLEHNNSACACGNIIDPDISVHQCPQCRKRSLPTITDMKGGDHPTR
ncbi:hypothetical protein [Thermoactinomyces sp. DSM 45892]|uniref:hypothetical protein n=1 Tax=Thermoactinomyces sp. DSM 45892 TaxID=1882753 RepID=UPI00089AF54A|nr:hypothetical protein [Thermoactinomyces sp. DSM 45892]SDY25345.1 hypothetical protein SAMN05444416_103100 [Thermoactinomyces sp. DSM 45892]